MLNSVLIYAALAAPAPPPATHCGAWQDGVGLDGHDIMYKMTDSAGGCCELCGRTIGGGGTDPPQRRCTGWTWWPGHRRCYLKTGVTSNHSAACISGGVTAGPPLPVPPPTPGFYCAGDDGSQDDDDVADVNGMQTLYIDAPDGGQCALALANLTAYLGRSAAGTLECDLQGNRDGESDGNQYAIGPKDNDQGNCDAAADALNAKLGTAGDQPTPWGLGFQCFDGGTPWLLMVPETDWPSPRSQGEPIDHTCQEKVAIMNQAVFGPKCNATIKSVTASWVVVQIIDVPTNVSYEWLGVSHSGPVVRSTSSIQTWGQSTTNSVSAGFSFGVRVPGSSSVEHSQSVSGSTSKSISQSTASTFALTNRTTVAHHYQPGVVVWQLQFQVVDSCGDSTVFTQQLTQTPNECGKSGTGMIGGKLLRTLATPTACACKAACGTVDGCQAWQWIFDLKVKNSKQCYLSTTGHMEKNTESISGVNDKPPCCLPGYFQDPTKPHGACAPGHDGKVFSLCT